MSPSDRHRTRAAAHESIQPIEFTGLDGDNVVVAQRAPLPA
jgi:hypothetical protein